MATYYKGVRSWSMTRDADGHRTYRLVSLVIGDTDDGPAAAITTPGIPLVGTTWVIGNDFDPWAWCRPEATVRPLVTDEPNRHFEVEQTFSTKPLSRSGFDGTGATGGGNGGGGGPSGGGGVEDPLQEPQKVSGSYVTYTEEATHDRFGVPIVNSAWEPIKGAQVEFDQHRSTLRIEQNVALLQADVFDPMVGTVNDAPIWGLPARCWKLTNVSWERKFHGVSQMFYTRHFEFESFAKVDPDTEDIVSGYDRDIQDEGAKVLSGRWANDGTWELVPIGFVLNQANPIMPDKNDPTHFMQAVDRQNNPTRIMLNGNGEPAITEADVGIIHIERDAESNFLTLGVPLIF